MTTSFAGALELETMQIPLTRKTVRWALAAVFGLALSSCTANPQISVLPGTLGVVAQAPDCDPFAKPPQPTNCDPAPGAPFVLDTAAINLDPTSDYGLMLTLDSCSSSGISEFPAKPPCHQMQLIHPLQPRDPNVNTTYAIAGRLIEQIATPAGTGCLCRYPDCIGRLRIQLQKDGALLAGSTNTDVYVTWSGKIKTMKVTSSGNPPDPPKCAP